VTKSEFVDQVADRAGLSKKDAGDAVDAMLETVEDALKRDAELDAQAIRVNVVDGTVTLEGKVKAWFERRVAEKAAWSAPGVRAVDDRIAVG